MTQIYPVNSLRGINLPASIIPDFMFQVGGDEMLIVQDVKGRVFVRKGTKWYGMKEMKVSELVEETVTVEVTPEVTPETPPAPDLQSGSSESAAVN